MIIKEQRGKRGLLFTIHHLPLIILLLFGCKTVEPLDDASANLNLWNEKKIENYSFSFKRICFCPVEYVGPHQVVVQNGKVVTVNGLPYNSSERYGVMYTIPELLQVIKVNLDKNPAKKTLNFNPTYGYPTSAFFDFSEMMADDEIGYEVTNFKIN
ncbi:MAG: hypothetical protein RJA67_1319 [Bacteroidota bacterium]|jgi:hypothetical protein